MKKDLVTGVSAPRVLPNMRTLCAALIVSCYFMRKQEVDIEEGLIAPENALNERQLMSVAQTFVSETNALLHHCITVRDEAECVASELSELGCFADLERFYYLSVFPKAVA